MEKAKDVNENGTLSKEVSVDRKKVINILKKVMHDKENAYIESIIKLSILFKFSGQDFEYFISDLRENISAMRKTLDSINAKSDTKDSEKSSNIDYIG